MFDRVVVDVIEMALEVIFVFDRVFPELRLPDTLAPFVLASGRNIAFGSARGQPTTGKLSFDPLPSRRILRIARRHAPN